MVKHERFPLPDGSVGIIEPIPGSPGALISREVDGEIVWGQCFRRDSDMEGLLWTVKASMTLNPKGFLSAWRRGIYDLPEGYEGPR